MNKRTILILIFVLCFAFVLEAFTQTVTVTGELKTWHTVTLNIEGPQTEEANANNPFLNYKVTGVFTNGTETFTVPGYFAADGDAANSGANSGNIWRVHFTPPAVGQWDYTVRFRSGASVALDNDIVAGTAVTPADNSTGNFTITGNDKEVPDLRAKGRLRYVGAHYLQFEGNGEWFIKAGPDSPENLLAYEDFDGTPNNTGVNGTANRKSWAPHVKDWEEGDPVWKTNKGKGIIGAINYLSAKGMNTIGFLTMNIQGDDKNVFPYPTSSNFQRFDCSKLDQWEILFDHAQKKGIHLHFKLQETENELVLDNGALETNRKLYYRELIARFSHHLAISWNLCEEAGAHFSTTNQTDAQRIEDIKYFADNDPYNHNRDIHTAPGNTEHTKIYTPLLGASSELTGASMQLNYSDSYSVTRDWVSRSAAAGKKWVVANDEQGPANQGVPNDAWNGSQNKHDIRKRTLWGNFMAGGAGVEYYFGYDRPHSDLTCQDFRYRDDSWDYCKHALDFFNLYLPFWEMENMHSISSASGTYTLGKEGEIYAVYFQSGTTSTIDLPAGTYSVKWYNPREGGGLYDGFVNEINGGANVSLGDAPDNNDWVALIRNTSFTHNGNQITYVECAEGSEVLTSYTDFSDYTGIAGFSPAYKDNDRQCLAIDAGLYKDVYAAAWTTYNGTSGKYNIKLNTLVEYDGESTYKLKINDQYVGEYQNPRTDQADDLTLNDTTWQEIDLNTGDKIQVEFNSHTNGLIVEGSGTAYSRGRWKSIEIIPLCLGVPGIEKEEEDDEVVGASQIWVEKNGILVADVESIDGYVDKNWAFKEGYDHMGSGYLQFTGANSMGEDLPENRLIFKIKISTPGDYEFLFRGKQPSSAATFDADNDAFVNILADDFFGLASGQSFPGTTRYSLHNPTKCWMQNKSSSTMQWITNAEFHGGGQQINPGRLGCTFDEAGIYEIHISGRSKNFTVDRFALAMHGKQVDAKAQEFESEILNLGPLTIVDSITISKSGVSLSVGEREAVEVAIFPTEATNKKLDWESSNSSVAAIINGEIVGKKAGVAAVIVRSDENSSIYKVISVVVNPMQSNFEIIYDNSEIDAIYADSEDTEWDPTHLKELAVDGDFTTFWHTQWYTAQPPHNHEIHFDLGSSRPLDRITYHTRQDGKSDGTIGSYELYISNDNTNWGAAKAIGKFTWPEENYNEESKTIDLDQTYTGRFVKLIAKDEVRENENFTHIAELVFKVDLTGIELVSNEELIGVGANTTLTTQTFPWDVSDSYPVSWSSSNTAVATVSDGVVTGNAVGMTYVVASILDGAYSDTCLVTVGTNNDTIITIIPTELELSLGNNSELNALTHPATYTIEWSSDNTGVVTVDPTTGVVTSISSGTAKIAALALNGRHSDTIEVSVVDPEISFDIVKDTMIAGNYKYATYTLNPSGSEIEWKSSNSEVATIDGGLIIAKASGDAMLIGSILGNTLSDTLHLNVYRPLVTLSSSKERLLVGYEVDLNATAFPDTNNITWISDDPSIAEVDETGTVKAVATGSTFITAGILGMEYKALCAIEVIVPKVKLSITRKSLQLEESFTLLAKPDPDTCVVTWSSDKPEVASVTNNGLVTAHTAGVANITASIFGGEAISKCVVTVIGPSEIKKHMEDIIKVYPNPTKGEFYISNVQTIDRIKVINTQGQVLTDVKPTSDYIDISLFENGMYFVKVITIEGDLLITPIIKQ